MAVMQQQVFTPMRVIQLAMATTILFSMVYTWQFVSLNVLQRSTTSMTANRLLGQTKTVMQGFDAGYKFVSEYDVVTQGPLYILFMSDANENGTYWCPDCERAKHAIYAGFERAPYGSRIVEIRVGSPEYWNDDMNAFRQNQLFYIDYIPTLIRYNGGGNSSALLTEKYCLDADLLDYVFRVHKPAVGLPNKNRIVKLNSGEQVMEFVKSYDNSYPLFMFFSSGFHSFNGRLWCPYCDRADVAIMHYYNYTALDSSVLLHITVAPSYQMWKAPHSFKTPEFQQNIVKLRGVPTLGFVKKDMTTNKIQLDQFALEFDQTDELKAFFRQQPTSAS